MPRLNLPTQLSRKLFIIRQNIPSRIYFVSRTLSFDGCKFYLGGRTLDFKVIFVLLIETTHFFIHQPMQFLIKTAVYKTRKTKIRNVVYLLSLFFILLLDVEISEFSFTAIQIIGARIKFN